MKISGRHLRPLLLGATVLAQADPSVPLGPERHWRIVAIGDSITQGNPVHWTYRYPLWKMLIDAGVDFDFVGSINYYDIVNPDIPPYRGRPFDWEHEGHVFFQSSEIAGQLPGWLLYGHAGSGGYVPDIALVHAGTNDALLAQPATGTIANLGSIIDTLRSRNPRVHVLLAKIIPIFNPLDPAGSANASASAINARIDGLAAAKTTPESRVVVVDHNAGFFPDYTVPPPNGGDTADGVHPSVAGEEKMARRWFEALQLFLLAPALDRDGEGRLTMNFVRMKAATRLTYRLGLSGDLTVWNWNAAVTESVTSTGPETEIVRMRDFTSEGARFIKLELDYLP